MHLVTGDAAGGQGGAQVLGEVKVEQSQLQCPFIWAEKGRADKPIPVSCSSGRGPGFCVG